MDKVAHFEIPADDLDRAKKFYQEVFAWQVNLIPEFNYALITTGPTDEKTGPTQPGFINGGMLKRTTPVTKPLITISVKSIDDTLKLIESNSGKVIRGKEPVGDEGFAAYFEDSEGNTTGLWEDNQKS